MLLEILIHSHKTYFLELLNLIRKLLKATKGEKSEMFSNIRL